jgi:thiamine biosynthesis lipoprotein
MFPKLFLVLLITVLSSACADKPEIIKLSGQAQGTTWNVSFWNTSDIEPEKIRQELAAELSRIDQILSNYRDDSHISQVNRNTTLEAIEIDPELSYLIEQARKVYIASQGCYDLTIKPLFTLWGFTGNALALPDPAKISDAMYSVGMDKIQIHENHLQKKIATSHIDVSSIGQGYSVAKLASILEKNGITNYLAEIGGELQTRGQKPGEQPWRVAIERPLPNAQGFQKVVTMDTTEPVSIMTSGTYRHFYDQDGQRYSHILDARTGRPVSHSTVSVTVIDPDPTLADAWSTALLCLGSEAGMAIANEHELAVLFIDQADETMHESSSDSFKMMKGIRVE